ncbi:uncharacterized protein LOC143362758 [Halictus rubicundus]|uniref:uncharacterized protein LOC143362758 n=1 Tax=Halictus rubicundus TaxID=77578 RepID=UPI004036AE54
MSMLAEPRRKQKWALNPRGKQWSEDSNKFGQKMLEKMGWTSGKGLGANEQGMTEHVRVSFKNDASGIGYKNDDLDKAWTEHQDGFNSFLQKLQKSQDDNVVQAEEVKTDISENSLELKSKQSRARVHYHKFVRGKDVKRYSSKDLANIFGQKELNRSKKNKNNENIDQKNVYSDPLGEQINRGGVITINGGNMADYFSKKNQNFSLTSKRKKRQESTSESEPEYVGFGFALTPAESPNDTKENKETEDSCNYAFENPCLRLNSSENISNNELKLESSKKRKMSNDSELTLNNNTDRKDDVKDCYKNAFVNAALNLELTIDEACNGKEFEVSRTQFGVTNSALDLQDEVVNKKRVTFNDHVEYNTDSVKKKKKKEKAMLDRFEVENKRSKKKKKQDNTNNSVSSGIINEALDVEEVSEEIHDNEINERKSSKPKKRKHSHRLNLETIVETPEEDKEVDKCGNEAKRLKVDESVIDDAIPQENLSSKKGKKKKKNKGKEKVEEEMTTMTDNNKIESAEKEVSTETEAESCKELDDTVKKEDEESLKVKEKKKKKKEKKGIETDSKAHGYITENQTETNDVEQKIKKLEEETVKVKKHKKKKTKDVDISNINADVNIKSEKEFFNNENKNGESVNTSKEEKPKKEKNKESIEDSSEYTCTTEPVREECPKPTVNTRDTDTNPQNTKVAHASLKSTKITHPSSKNIKLNASSPWSEKAKTSKQILRSLFYRNSVAHFPGANVDEIKGYGTDIYNED